MKPLVYLAVGGAFILLITSIAKANAPQPRRAPPTVGPAVNPAFQNNNPSLANMRGQSVIGGYCDATSQSCPPPGYCDPSTQSCN